MPLLAPVSDVLKLRTTKDLLYSAPILVHLETGFRVSAGPTLESIPVAKGGVLARRLFARSRLSAEVSTAASFLINVRKTCFKWVFSDWISVYFGFFTH